MLNDDLNRDLILDLARRIKSLETSASLGHSSVSNGLTEFIGSPSIQVSGSGDVTGSWNIDGTLNVSGTNHTTGTTNQDGPLNVNGASTFIGDESHEGTVTIKGDLDIEDGGKINVDGSGDMTIGTLDTGRAGIHFAGGDLSSDDDQVALSTGNNFVGVGNGNSILGAGSNAIVVREGGIYILGLQPKPTSTPPTDA